jgi:hypothetical protein
MPVAFVSLPAEILLVILQLLTPDSLLPAVGSDADWAIRPITFVERSHLSRFPTHARVTIKDQRSGFLTDIANLQQ